MKRRVLPVSEPGPPSTMLRKHANFILSQSSGKALDAPCGYGRNSFFLAELGISVMAVDKSAICLSVIEQLKRERLVKDLIETSEIDLLGAAIPLETASFGCVLNVHFCSAPLLERLIPLVAPSGFLYVETIANRGENYLELPDAGELLSLVADEFNLIDHVEKPAGPPTSGKVTTRLLARKLK